MLHDAGTIVLNEGLKELRELNELQKNKAKLASFIKSLKLAIDVIKNPLNTDKVKALQDNATNEAIGKSSCGKKFIGALLFLVGTAIIGLSLAGIPYSGGSSLTMMNISASLLTAGGAILFYHGTKRKLAKALSNLSEAALKTPKP